MSVENQNQEMVIMTKEDLQKYSENLIAAVTTCADKKIQEIKDLIENNFAIEHDGYLTLDGVVSMYHIKRGTLYEYLGRKKKGDDGEANPIPAYKIGGMWLFRKEELDKWVDAHADHLNKNQEYESLNSQIGASHRRQPKPVNF